MSNFVIQLSRVLFLNFLIRRSSSNIQKQNFTRQEIFCSLHGNQQLNRWNFQLKNKFLHLIRKFCIKLFEHFYGIMVSTVRFKYDGAIKTNIYGEKITNSFIALCKIFEREGTLKQQKTPQIVSVLKQIYKKYVRQYNVDDKSSKIIKDDSVKNDHAEKSIQKKEKKKQPLKKSNISKSMVSKKKSIQIEAEKVPKEQQARDIQFELQQKQIQKLRLQNSVLLQQSRINQLEKQIDFYMKRRTDDIEQSESTVYEKPKPSEPPKIGIKKAGKELKKSKVQVKFVDKFVKSMVVKKKDSDYQESSQESSAINESSQQKVYQPQVINKIVHSPKKQVGSSKNSKSSSKNSIEQQRSTKKLPNGRINTLKKDKISSDKIQKMIPEKKAIKEQIDHSILRQFFFQSKDENEIFPQRTLKEPNIQEKLQVKKINPASKNQINGYRATNKQLYSGIKNADESGWKQDEQIYLASLFKQDKVFLIDICNSLIAKFGRKSIFELNRMKFKRWQLYRRCCKQFLINVVKRGIISKDEADSLNNRMRSIIKRASCVFLNNFVAEFHGKKYKNIHNEFLIQVVRSLYNQKISDDPRMKAEPQQYTEEDEQTAQQQKQMQKQSEETPGFQYQEPKKGQMIKEEPVIHEKIVQPEKFKNSVKLFKQRQTVIIPKSIIAAEKMKNMAFRTKGQLVDQSQQRPEIATKKEEAQVIKQENNLCPQTFGNSQDAELISSNTRTSGKRYNLKHIANETKNKKAKINN